jgi:NADH:ubiquinone oxidoreductase subunit E
MLGAHEAMHEIEEKIKSMGESCPYQLEAFPCLGKCDGAPVVLVNKERHEKITADKVDELLARYK